MPAALVTRTLRHGLAWSSVSVSAGFAKAIARRSAKAPAKRAVAALSGVPVPPDGVRGKVLELGPVLAYDMPERAAFFKLKALTTIQGTVKNTVEAWGVAATWVKKF